MADNQTERDAARNRAQKHFAASEQRDVLVKQMIESERAAVAARTAKLKALRLAKEEADRLAAPAASGKPAKKTRARKARTIKV
ncbi:MAG: hypothetical protein WBQ17_05815 [Rhizomicrobium sp.]|jgi:hypothetical protein